MADYSTAETTLSTLERDSIAAKVAQSISNPKRAQLVLVGHSPSPSQSMDANSLAFPVGTLSRNELDSAFGNLPIVENAICINANATIYRAKNSRAGFEYEPAKSRLRELVSLLAPETRPYKVMFVAFGGDVLRELTYAIWKHFEAHPAQPAPKEILNWAISPTWHHYERLNLSLLGMYHPASNNFKERMQEPFWAAAVEKLSAEVS